MFISPFRSFICSSFVLIVKFTSVIILPSKYFFSEKKKNSFQPKISQLKELIYDSVYVQKKVCK